MNTIANIPKEDFSKSFISWDNKEGFEKASAALNKGLQTVQPISRSTAAIADRYKGIDSNVSVRDSFNRLDYDFFRPGERVPTYFRDVIAACMGAYEKVPIIKQVIDLMGDFTSQGIRLVHPNESIERFYNEWFLQVQGEERTERMSNCLYRCGNVIVKRANAVLSPDAISSWKKTIARVDLKYEEGPTILKNAIPYRYTILNPLVIEVLGEHMAAFTGKTHYILKLPTYFYNNLSFPLEQFNTSILTQGLPLDIKEALDNKQQYLYLDNEKLETLFYKKDDWNVWAYPMLYSLLDEIILLQKMKMADMTALDGVISHIRIFKLGSLEHKIFPTNAAITKLSNILLNNVAGGAIDFIWGPDLELAETSTDIASFLGSEKYEYVVNTINAGLGVPAAIGRSKGSMTDNFMSIRVMLERLIYGRKVLTRFWNKEIRLVQKAMGFRYPAKVVFDNINLHDETAEKALWIQLADRNLIPVEAVQERFGRIPEIDNILLMREEKRRAAGKMPVKITPYTDAEPQLSLTKIGMQRGLVSPEALPDKFSLELKESNQQDLLNISPAKPTIEKKKPGISGQGRPPGSQDTKKRKERVPKPNSRASEFIMLTLHGNKLQKCISEVVDPFFLSKNGKKSIAEFSPDQGVEMEKFKFNLMCSISPEDDINYDTIAETLGHFKVENYAEELYKSLSVEFRRQKNADLTSEDNRNIKSYVYALVQGKYR